MDKYTILCTELRGSAQSLNGNIDTLQKKADKLQKAINKVTRGDYKASDLSSAYTAQSALTGSITRLGEICNAMDSAAAQFSEASAELSGRANLTAYYMQHTDTLSYDGLMSTYSAAITSAGGAVAGFELVKDALQNNGYSVGSLGSVSNAVQDAMQCEAEEQASRMNAWQKVWKTGAAVLSIAGAGVAAAASWAVAGGTAGFGAPGAILVSGYSLNTIASSGTDLYNIWFGDQKKVGKVNYLKSGLTEGGGDLTEMLCGNRAVGEMIGKGVYAAGNFASGIISARSLVVLHGGGTPRYGSGTELTSLDDFAKNQVIGDLPHNKVAKYLQSGMLDGKYISKYDVSTGKYLTDTEAFLKGVTGNGFIDTGVKAIKEIPTAVKGYWELIKNPSLGSLSYDLKMLGCEIENLTEVSSFIKSTGEMVELVKDAYDITVPKVPLNPGGASL